ncbi:MAG: PatA/PatG family cyanobactin maturation protease [Symploca sp. SIO2E6]|nr:PatA/PatG family cyanobactin maturation protease [Symploca sp. SIO2E6]
MNKSLGDSNVCIAILDGAVDLSHPCFAGAKITQLTTLVPAVADGGAASQHGTHVASIIFGQQGSSVQGIAPNCRGLILPIFSSGKRDQIAPCSQIDLARAITQAVQAGANVINISGGQLTASPESDQLLANAVRLCQEKNVLIVAAAGNDGCACLHIPAAMESVLAVGAMDAQGNPLDSSNWGKTYQNQGILALGENILGATPGGGTTLRSGTSFATPVVSGTVANLLSIQWQRGEKPDPHGVREAILKSALPCNEQKADQARCLVGRLNFSGAYTLITQGGIKSMSEQTLEETMVQPSEVNSIDQELTTNEIEIESTQTIEAINPSSQETVSQVAMGIQEAEAKTSPVMPTNISNNTVNPIMGTPNNQAVSSITPSGADGGCGCGGGGSMQIVYPIGRLGITFSNVSQRDGIQQLMGLMTPPTEQQLLDYFAGRAPYPTPSPWVAENVIWTLNLNATAIYAIYPSDPYANHTYELLREFLEDQLQGGVKLTTVPGVISGQVSLLSGQSVPVISPYIPGLSNWSPPQLVRQVLHDRPSQPGPEQDVYNARSSAITEYLQRIYYSLLNLGITPQDRAKNFSATNIVQVAHAIKELIPESSEPNKKEKLALDTITVEKSTICPPNADCWDIKLIFFDPSDLRQAREVVLFTIDVSNVMPVSIGAVRHWPIY